MPFISENFHLLWPNVESYVGCQCQRQPRGSGSVLEALSGVSLGRPWEFHAEAAALARLGIEAKPAVHAFDGFFDDGQADAGAGLLAFGVHTLEHAKDLLLGVLGDTDAVILHPDAPPLAGG